MHGNFLTSGGKKEHIPEVHNGEENKLLLPEKK